MPHLAVLGGLVALFRSSSVSSRSVQNRKGCSRVSLGMEQAAVYLKFRNTNGDEIDRYSLACDTEVCTSA